MINKLVVFFLLFSHSTWAIELQCIFEEVYENSQTQQGLVLIKNNKLRYEYFDKNLFTIFRHNNEFLVVENAQPEIFKKINQNTIALNKITEIANQYPDIKEIYEEEDLTILLEKNETGFFVRRIGILSENLNMSIFLNDCKEVSLSDKYLKFFPYFKYTPQ